jgi:hypothetical protein
MKRKSSYGDSLVAAIWQWLPGRFFSQWAQRAGITWTPQRLLWIAFLMTWGVDQTLKDQFEAARDLLRSLFPRWQLGTTFTGWSEAMRVWSPILQPAVAKRLRQQMQGLAGRYWQREGWCAFAADGSRVECPRTAANEEALGCAGKERTAPQLFLTTLWHMGLGLPWDYRIGPGTASERRHLEAMLPTLPSNALLVADAGFVGYDLCRRIIDAGQSFLLRVGANVHLLKELGFAQIENSQTVYLWPTDRQDQPPLVLRMIVVPRGVQRMVLLTNVLDETALTDETAAVLYEMRWGIEVFYRSFKQTLSKRKMRSHAPAQAERELSWAVLGLWLLGIMSVAAILANGHDPLSWSAALARKQVRQTLRRALTLDRRCPQPLALMLADARQDNYVRTRTKKARNWPHKKREKPPGEPKITVASLKQIARAQQHLSAVRMAA